tara:strand:- start:3447 stop:4589 length:1143 start_codon:yes stop_codon:yes gene_type:complete
MQNIRRLMENSFNTWFLEKGLWVAVIAVAGIIGVWVISILLFKVLKLLGVDPERISDHNSRTLVTKIKNIFVILVAIVVAGIPSVFAILSIFNIKDSEEGLDWAIGASYKLIVSNGIPIAIVILLAYISLRVAGTIMPNLIKLYLNSNSRTEDLGTENEKRVETFAIVIRSFLRIFVVLIALLTILSILGVPITSLVAGVSIIGIAVGLGSQSLVKDVIQGMLILAENQLRKGDIVNVNNRRGLVEDLNLRRILLRDLDGALVIIPNGSADIITNYTSQWSRVNVEMTIKFEDDLDRVIAVIDGVGEKLMQTPKISGFIKEVPKVFVVRSFSDSGVNIRVIGVTQPGKQWEVRTHLLREIKSEFDKQKIEIPYRHIKVIN